MRQAIGLGFESRSCLVDRRHNVHVTVRSERHLVSLHLGLGWSQGLRAATKKVHLPQTEVEDFEKGAVIFF